MRVTSFYYAHPITQYGTPVEKQIEQAFHEQFPDAHVENPNQPVHQQGFEHAARTVPARPGVEPGMSYFVDLCARQDAVFFTTFSDGRVGAGVTREVQSFVARNAPVYYFNPLTGQFVPLPEGLKSFKTLSLEETKANRKREQALIESGAGPYVDLEHYRAALEKASISTVA